MKSEINSTNLFSSSVWDSMMDGQADTKDERQQYLQQEQFKQQNPLFRDGNEETHELGSTDQYDDDEHNNYLHDGAATNYNYAYVSKPNDLDNNEYLEQNSNYLMGSNVQYMMPDGTPVKGMIYHPAPQDDDRDDMTMGSRKMPTMQQLYDSIATMDEAPKIIMVPPPSSSTTTTAASTSTASSSDAGTDSYRTIKTLYGTYRIH
jgi:hypothetical protein